MMNEKNNQYDKIKRHLYGKNKIWLVIRALLIILWPVILFFIFGLKVDVLLAIIIIYQLYLIAIQVELSLRREIDDKMKYQPVLSLDVMNQNFENNSIVYTIKIKNIGQYPAHIVILKMEGKEISTFDDEKIIGPIEPGQETDVKLKKFISKQELEYMCINVMAIYFDIFGEERTELHEKFPELESFWRIPLKEEPLGLLRILQEAVSIMRGEKSGLIGKREYIAPALMGGLWGAATLEDFFINIWLNWEPGWLVKLITLPGYLAHFIPWPSLPILSETIGGLLELLSPVVIGGLLGAGLHHMLIRRV